MHECVIGGGEDFDAPFGIAVGDAAGDIRGRETHGNSDARFLDERQQQVCVDQKATLAAKSLDASSISSTIWGRMLTSNFWLFLSL